ncbi:hypothetical protein AX14_006256 [Amanita brunnescens Koide BX004]|nr:hypothetical protein AX14_006256 [Amanita brunnescens Koide BX004]
MSASVPLSMLSNTRCGRLPPIWFPNKAPSFIHFRGTVNMPGGSRSRSLFPFPGKLHSAERIYLTGAEEDVVRASWGPTLSLKFQSAAHGGYENWVYGVRSKVERPTGSPRSQWPPLVHRPDTTRRPRLPR